jgi:uncharacterized protein with HEPN domain
VSRSDHERLRDILAALDRCVRFRSHLDSRDGEMSAMAFDATLRNLAVVGEAARSLSEEVRGHFAEVPWHSIAGLRNVVVHEYFRIESGVIRDVVDSEVAPLAVAIRHYLGEPTAPSGDTRG